MAGWSGAAPRVSRSWTRRPASDGGGGDDLGELLQGDVVGAGAGDEGSAGAEHLHGAEVELLVAAHGSFGGALGLGEGGWIEDDGVVLLAGGFVLAEEFEGVGFDPVDLGGEARG